MLTNGKGFYHPLVYVLESHRLGLKFLPPSVNEPGTAFVPHGDYIRVPVTRVKGITTRTTDAMIQARERGVFTSLSDFFHRVYSTFSEKLPPCSNPNSHRCPFNRSGRHPAPARR